MSLSFTLLTKEQIWGSGKGGAQLDVIRKCGEGALPSDLTILLGETIAGDSYDDLAGNASFIWTASPHEAWTSSPEKLTGDVALVGPDASQWHGQPRTRNSSIRPVLPPTETEQLTPIRKGKESHGVEVVEYGEYPQMLADDATSSELERAFNDINSLLSIFKKKKLKPTDKKYTFDTVPPLEDDLDFRPGFSQEYEYMGKKYIRILGEHPERNSKLSSGERVESGKPYWIEVQPIEWLVDSSGAWIAKKCLFSGIPFDTKRDYDGDFSQTFMKKYLDTYFAQEIETPEIAADREKRVKREETIKGIKAKLAEAIDPKKVKATVGFTRTESRREIAEAIKTTRRARDVFIAAGKQAQKEGDQELVEQIVEMADFYVRSDQAQRGAARQRRAEYRAKRAAAKKDSGR